MSEHNRRRQKQFGEGANKICPNIFYLPEYSYVNECLQ